MPNGIFVFVSVKRDASSFGLSCKQWEFMVFLGVVFVLKDLEAFQAPTFIS